MSIPVGFKKTAVICVLRHKAQFLLLKRHRDPHKGLYTPVRGKLEPFENPKQAAKRETFEGTGISVLGMRYCGILVENSTSNYNWCSFVYLADVDLVAPPRCAEGQLEWVETRRLGELPTPPSDQFIYQYLLAEKPFAFSADYDERMGLRHMSEEISGQLVYQM